jgi:D-tagatose-1,6-bisphosphate aldolase subunit GatZ/KbaZ
MREIIRKGISSICSANEFVLEAALEKGTDDSKHVLIESTSNQVNQFGGYTGMKPAGFAGYVKKIAELTGLPEGRLILGGDHLGPYPWRKEPAETAMSKAEELVRECVRAGYVKIHLDSSMKLGDDPGGDHQPLPPELIAERSARLCRAAEDALDSGQSDGPVYIVGTEVPVPGGTEEEEGAPEVTKPEDFYNTVETNRLAFEKAGLEAAWKRVVAVVVQPGVEFSDTHVYPYDSGKAAQLSDALRNYPGLVFEGHSTDYQDRELLFQMVDDGITLLKVGPALTFAMREAVFLLSYIEEEMYASGLISMVSEIKETLDRVMLAKPENWKDYYTGREDEIRYKRFYSLSDRIRYYWNDGEVQTSLAVLLSNLRENPIPGALVSQFFPEQARVPASQRIAPEELIKNRIKKVLCDYP